MEPFSDISRSSELIYSEGKTIIDFKIPSKTLLPGEYKFVLGSCIETMGYINNPYEFEIFVCTTVQNNNKPIFISEEVLE